jgi:hypothetical protein
VSVPFGDQDMADQVMAAADLVQRTGARQFEIGYVHDDVPADQAGWYAHARYRGALVGVSDQPSPIDAADGLARRLLDGARCGCGKPVTVDGIGKPGQCAWHRDGPVWVSACGRGAVRPPRDAR